MYKYFILLTFLVLTSCSNDDTATENNNNNTSFKVISSVVDYENEIKSGVSLMFFHATWCSICKAQRPSVEALMTDNALKTVKFGQIDTDKNKDITTKFNVPGQPVIVIYKDGKEQNRFAGSGHSQQKLGDILKALL
jgi:thioredoxin 1